MRTRKWYVITGSRPWWFLALLVLTLLAGCGRSGGGDDNRSAVDDPPPTGPVSELSGDPARAVTAAVSDLFAAAPAPASEVGQDASGVAIVRTEIEIGLVDNATVADANRLLAGIDGEIVAMAEGVPQLLVRIPDPGSLAALDVLIATLESDPAVAYVSRGVVPAVAGLPDNVAPSQASEMEKLRHLLAIRGNGAWHASEVVNRLGSRPPLMVVADAFGAGMPGSDFDILTSNTDYTSAGLDPHGYFVLGVMSARFGGGAMDRGRITGLYPATLDVGAIDMAAPVSMNQLDWAIVRRVNGSPNPRVIVNTSLAFPCNDASSVATYCSESHARERALRWIIKVRGNGLENRFLHVAAAGNVDVAGDLDARLSSTYAAAHLITDLQLADGTPVPPLTNTLVVENLAASDTLPYRPVCLASYSKRAGDLGAIGTNVWSLAGPDSGDGIDSGSGSSQAAPAVSATAAFVWTMNPGLDAGELRDILVRTSRPVALNVLANGACDLLAAPAPVIDAYDALLAADSEDALGANGRPALAPVRVGILDIAGATGAAGSNGRFDDKDLARWLAKLQVLPAPLDYSRYDLNGDGHTGGDTRERLDLDLDGMFESQVSQDIEGDSIDFDENTLSDMQVLCYYAYSPLYTGDSDERQRLMGPHLGQCGKRPRLAFGYGIPNQNAAVAVFDGHDVRRIWQEGIYSAPQVQSWSPDGTKLLLLTGATHVVVHTDGSGVIYEGDPNEFDVRATAGWPEDGKSILLVDSSRYIDDTYTYREILVYRIDLENGAKTLVNGRGLAGASPALSVDGQWLVFEADTPSVLYIARSNGAGAVTAGLGFRAHFSPSGNRLLFRQYIESEGLDRWMIAGVGAGSVVQLPGNSRDYEIDHRGKGISWSPDETRVVYSRRTGSTTDPVWRIYVFDLNSGTETRLDTGSDNDAYPAWSPDGRKIAFLRDAFAPYISKKCGDLYLMDADGSNVTPVDIGPGKACYPLEWAP